MPTLPEINSTLTLNSFGLLVVLAWPGLISIHVYRLLIPAEALDWKEVLPAALFYSAVNYVVCLPVIPFLLKSSNAQACPLAYGASIAFVALICPVCLPVVYRLLLSKTQLARWLQSPFPTAFDYHFDKRQPCFAIVHLLDGTLVGGYWGPGSYASSYPNEGDLYFSHTIQMIGDGTFGDVMDDTDGLLVRKDQYTYLELFKVPVQNPANEASDGEED